MSEILHVVDAVAMTRESISKRGRCRAVSTMLHSLGVQCPSALVATMNDAVADERRARLAIARAALLDPSSDDAAALHLVRLAAFGTGPQLQVVADCNPKPIDDELIAALDDAFDQ